MTLRPWCTSNSLDSSVGIIGWCQIIIINPRGWENLHGDLVVEYHFPYILTWTGCINTQAWTTLSHSFSTTRLPLSSTILVEV